MTMATGNNTWMENHFQGLIRVRQSGQGVYA